MTAVLQFVLGFVAILVLLGLASLLFMFSIFQEINRRKFKARCNAEQYSLIRKYENIPFWRVEK